MCLAIPGEVVSIKGNVATVCFMGALREISIDFLEDVKIGELVLSHAGCAIAKVDEQEANQTLKIFTELVDEFNT